MGTFLQTSRVFLSFSTFSNGDTEISLGTAYFARNTANVLMAQRVVNYYGMSIYSLVANFYCKIFCVYKFKDDFLNSLHNTTAVEMGNCYFTDPSP